MRARLMFPTGKEGFDVTYLQVGSDGLLDLEELKAALTDQTILVSIMSVQNEIGTIQPMAKIGAICRERKVFLHTDAAQAVGKIPIDVKQMKIDLLSLTAHKIFGPMGIGALYVGKKPRVRLEPIFSGGGQEKGLRSGTLAPALCVGLGEALRIADEEMFGDAARLGALRDQMWQRLNGAVPGLVLNGSMTNRIGVNLNFSVDGADAESLMAALPGLAVSSGPHARRHQMTPLMFSRPSGSQMYWQKRAFGSGWADSPQQTKWNRPQINSLKR